MLCRASVFSMLIVSLAGAAALSGCASEPPPRAPVVAPASEKEAIDDPSRLNMTSEIGGLPEEAMERAFASFGKDVEGCVTAGYAHVDSLGGRVTINLRIDTSGAPTDIFLSESALGDRATEKCILDAAADKQWPHAVGGVGIASSSFDTTPAKDRATCDEKNVRGAIAQARAKTMQCRRGSDADFVVTAYVKADGRVQSAGLSTSTAQAIGAADCIVDAVRKVKFGNPGKEAKLRFSL
jgi:hypothetical protein